MSVTINESAIHSQSAVNPSHTAPRGVLHLNTASGAVFAQIDGPTGSNWVSLTRNGGLEVFVEVENVIEIEGNLEIFTEV